MIKKVWLLYSGVYGSEGSVDCIFSTKKEAIAYVKSLGGYKYSEWQNLWCNDESGYWYRVDGYPIFKTANEALNI